MSIVERHEQPVIRFRVVVKSNEGKELHVEVRPTLDEANRLGRQLKEEYKSDSSTVEVIKENAGTNLRFTTSVEKDPSGR